MAANYSFPLDSEDPKKKEKPKWLREYARAAVRNYSNLPEGAVGMKSRVLYDTYRLYSLAQQPVSKYKNIFNYGEDWQKSLKVVDWSIQSDIPKYLQVIGGILSKVDFNVQINPIDPVAKDEMEDEILRQEAKLLIREMNKAQGAEAFNELPSLKVHKDEAEDLDDLNVKELGMRHRTAREMEAVVQLTLNGSNFEDVVIPQVNTDLICCGVCVLKDELVNKSTIEVKRKDPSDLIISYCQNDDFSDWKHIGILQPVQVCELVVMAQGQVTEAEVKEIYRLGQQEINNWGVGDCTWGNNEMDFYQRGVVNVLDLEIRSTDRIVAEERELPDGNKIFKTINPKKKGQNSKNKYEETTIENIYHCKWVVGTDIIFDCGKKLNMKRDAKNPSLVKSSYHIFACDLYKMKAKSRMESAMVYADAIQVYSLKVQHVLNSLIPSGYMINIDALEGVDLGAGAKKMSPKSVLELLFSRGILLARSQALGTEGKNLPKAIERLESTGGIEVVELVNRIKDNQLMLKESLGLNEFTDGSTPNPRALTEIAKAGTMGTKNALSDIFRIHRRIVKSISNNIVISSQDIVKRGDTRFLLASLGTGTVKRLKSIDDIHKYMYSVEIEENPSQEDLIALDEQIKIGLQNGDITAADVLMLSSMSNIKSKEEFLVYRIKKNQERKQEEAIALQKTNGEIQQQSAQIAAQMQQQTLQMEFDLKMKLIQLEKDLELRNASQVEQFRIEGKNVDATGRVEAAQVQANAKEVTNLRDNEVKLATDESNATVDLLKVDIPFRSNVTPETANGQELTLQPFDFFSETEQEEPEMEQQEMMMQ